MKTKIFIVDLLLLTLFILTAISGFRMHIVGHGNSHFIWHNWAIVHTISTLFFTIATILHVYFHWNWYKGLFFKPFGKKSKVTIIVSLLFLTLTISGFLAFVPQGPNSNIGITHYKIGIVSTLFFIIHIIKRYKILFKGLFKKNK
ncbi:MAG: DUF4405 domain-containing protein [Bacteroidales bacterium]|nr:DUF4405 domain-containing protein [Bacteroidales bacterium]